MESLTGLNAKIIERNNYVSKLITSKSNIASKSALFCSKPTSNTNNTMSYYSKTSYSLTLFHSISYSQLSHCLPLSTSQEGLGIETMGIRKSVSVKFQLEKECQFGHHFLMVGDDPILGSWNSSNAVPFNWSEGHIWSLMVELPVNKSIRYKFLLKKSTEEILWQPGPDRVFESWDTENVIIVSEEWENADAQKISEEQHIFEEDEQMPLVMSSPSDHYNIEVSGSDENLNVEDCNRYLPSGASVTKKSKSSVTSSLEKLPTISQERVRTDQNAVEADYEGSLILDDEGPVLVPGLTIPFVS